MPTNDERADRAYQALSYYVKDQLGEVFEESGGEIADLITDLLHLTKRWDNNNDSVDRVLRIAQMDFETEQAEDD